MNLTGPALDLVEELAALERRALAAEGELAAARDGLAAVLARKNSEARLLEERVQAGRHLATLLAEALRGLRSPSGRYVELGQQLAIADAALALYETWEREQP